MEVILTGTGTSQGVPVIGCDCPVCTSDDPRDERLRTSCVFYKNGLTFVIDVGPDFRQQLLAHEVNDVHAILLTHEHNDHVSGLDDVRPLNFRHRKDIPVYGLERSLNELRQRFAYIFDSADRYPGKPRVALHAIEVGLHNIGGVSIEAIPVMHGTMPVLGFVVDDFCYITDANQLSARVIERIRGIKLLVVNALHHRQHYAHYNLQEALAVLEEIRPETAVLTHVSHSMGRYRDIQHGLPSYVRLGYDGMRFVL